MAIKNFAAFSEMIGTGGQPTDEDLQTAAEDGYQEIINLATYDKDPDMAKREEKAAVELGMGYHSIPVVWDNPLRTDFDEFAACMRSLRGKKVLVHCAANYRATAFAALYGIVDQGLSEDKADEFIRSIWNPAKFPEWDRLISEIKSSVE
ncbi:MAG: phosphatase [Spirochaetales bacterium]|jgi:protein tyrosine phosphatase (PTP) superfamily phosphohydrolase (DUF442 family)|nr:phosphatase [Spirochaetales bacterium]